MDDDDQEIYSAPSEAAVKTNFSQLLKAFENKNTIPIRVADDGRHQSKDPDPSLKKPRPSFRPKPSGKPPALFDQNCKPGLPTKVSKLPKSGDKNGLPVIPDKKSPVPSPTKISQTTATRRASERDSIFPPLDSNAENVADSSSLDRKAPLKSINGMKLPLKPDQSIIQCPHGSFKQLPLPPLGRGAPKKPAKIPASHILLEPGSPDPTTEGVEPDEIYDDVSTPMADFPPPPADLMRPVSMIPEMTEEDELSDDDEGNKPAGRPQLLPNGKPVPPKRSDTDDQEVYDDVAPGDGSPELQEDEIYEDI